MDLLIPGLEHRGPTHSVIFILALAIPLVLKWRKQALPYIAAFATHPLLGDYLTSSSQAQGVQLFFPLSSRWFAAGSEALGFVYVYLELAFFVAVLGIMVSNGDIKILTQAHPSNLLHAIPLFTALLPAFARFPIPVPPILIIPHIILIFMLAVPLLIDIRLLIRR